MQRPLLLTGFMATGKTTVARRVAEATGHPWVDLDGRIEERAGKKIPAIFADDGESTFRARERAELLRLLQGWREEFALAPVVSLGGGALLDRATRLEAIEGAVVVALTAGAAEIVRRLEADAAAVRPLLGSARGAAAEARVRELLEARAVAYQECHGQVATDGRELEAIQRDVLQHWERDGVAVAAGAASYVVEIGSDCLETRLAALVGCCSSALLVTDRTVGGLYGAQPFERS